MYNFQSNSYNGVEVAYATLPMYMLNIVSQDTNLTSASKLVFIRLMAYASAKNNTSFGITAQWVADNTGLNRNTVSRALTLLRLQKYINDDGIVYQAPPEKVPRVNVPKISANKTAKPVVDRVCEENKPATDEVKIVKEEPVKAQEKREIPANGLAMLIAMGIKKRQPTPQNDAVVIEKDPEPMPQTVAEMLENVAEPMPHFEQPMLETIAPMLETIASHITIPNNNLLNNTPTANADAVGLFSDSASVGFVAGPGATSKTNARRSNRPMSMAEIFSGKPKTLKRNEEAYIESALKRMNVTSASERERYTAEIGYSSTQGTYTATYTEAPMKAIRACLNLVERGAWKHPVGMYA